MKNLVDKAVGIDPRLTWEETPKGLKGTYCPDKPNKPGGKVSIVSGVIKNAKSLSSKEFVEQVHALSHALRNYVHKFTKDQKIDPN